MTKLCFHIISESISLGANLYSFYIRKQLKPPSPPAPNNWNKENKSLIKSTSECWKSGGI